MGKTPNQIIILLCEGLDIEDVIFILDFIKIVTFKVIYHFASSEIL